MTEESLSQMIARVRASVVRIQTHSSIGTGVIFSADGQYGYIATNQHVVGDAHEVMVTVNDSNTLRGLVLERDDIYDLAFVKIEGRDLRAIPFGDSSRVNAGTEVVAIGYPLNYQSVATVTTGIVSARPHNPQYRSEVIMSDVTMNPGNSGGPMLSVSGEILGINTFMSANNPGNAYGFAIPESAVRTFASRSSVPIPPARPQTSGQATTPPSPSPSPQAHASPQASASPSRLSTYLKSFGLGFAAGAVLGVAVARFAVGVEGDLSASLIISGLIGGSLALVLRMKIH